MPLFSRRHALGLGLGALSAVQFGPRATAADPGAEAHGLSVFGDLKYPADFQHFDYVNVDAPKGGMFSYLPWQRANNQSFQTFNSLNVRACREIGADFGRQADLSFHDAAGGEIPRRLETDRA
jgi:microcin C transport system substrate-binding protein